MLLKILRVIGHSMQPTIIDGRIVLASNIPYLFSSPKVDDIVAFKLKDKVFVKRIKKIENNKYMFRGDNKKDSLDSRRFGAFGREDILAKVIWF